MDENTPDNSSVPASAAPSYETVAQIESLIKSYISRLDTLDKELKKYREMLDNTFANDPVFVEHDKAVKEATKIRNATRQQILKTPHAQNLHSKVKEFRAQIIESKESLSSYLQDYQRLTGSNEIETETGVRQIIYTAKLIKLGSPSSRPGQ